MAASLHGLRTLLRPIPVLAALAVLAAPSGALAGPSRAQASAPPVVRVASGLLRGRVAGDHLAYLGIPYAAPPVGRLRWRAPAPVHAWSGVRAATAYGSPCPQRANPGNGIVREVTDENCLFLNVYAPRAPGSGARLPVMVWIHGGGFSSGAGSLYDGSRLAVAGHVIVVTVNYRLGALGFLAHPALDAERRDRSSGDYGLLDQQYALRWVRRNIGAFGGDPARVTLFGESAGGVSVCANLASPVAAGLFARAIAESGCILGPLTRAQGEQHGLAFATRAGCPRATTAARCLRRESVRALIAAQTALSSSEAAYPLAWAPVAGGPTLPRTTLSAFAAGRFARIPFIQGSNTDEGSLFIALGFDLHGGPVDARRYPRIVDALFGPRPGNQVLAQYPLSGYRSPDLALTAIVTDSSFACPALLADGYALGPTTYGYEFADPNAPFPVSRPVSFPLGAYHSAEIQYLFGRTIAGDRSPPFTAAQRALSAQMMGYWARFAATGDPNGGGAPPWAPLAPGGPALERFAPTATTPLSAAAFAAEHACSFWSAIGGELG